MDIFVCEYHKLLQRLHKNSIQKFTRGTNKELGPKKVKSHATIFQKKKILPWVIGKYLGTQKAKIRKKGAII